MGDINYVRSYANATERQFAKSYRGANYLRLAKLFQTQYVKTYTRHYLGEYEGTFEGSFNKQYEGTFLGSYTKTYAGGYTKTYLGLYTNTYIGQGSKQYEGHYTKTYTGLYEGTFLHQWEGAFTGTFSKQWTGVYAGGPYQIQYEGSFNKTYVRGYSKNYTHQWEGLYTHVWEGSYTRTFTRQFEGSFNKTYVGAYVAHWSRDFVAHWTGNRAHSFSRALTFTGNYVRDITFAGTAYSNVVDYNVTYSRSYTGPFQYFTGQRAYVGPDLAPGEPGNFYVGPANYARSLYVGNYVKTWSGTPSYIGTYSGASETNVYIGTYVRVMIENEPGFPMFFEDVYYQGSYTGLPSVVYNDYVGIYTAPEQTFSPLRNSTATYTSSRNSIGTYTGQYEGIFAGLSYEGTFAGITYLGHYTKTYTGQYEGNFTRTFIGYYEKVYAGQYTKTYTKTYERGYTRAYVGLYEGDVYYSGNTIGNFEGQFTGNYTRSFLKLFEAAYTGQFEGEFNKQYSGLYNKQYEGSFNKQYEGAFDKDFGGTYDKTYVGTYLGQYTKTYVGEYSRLFEGSFAKGYNKGYIGHYSGSYSEATKSFAYFVANWSSPLVYNKSYAKAVTEVANTMHGELTDGGVKKVKEDGKWKQVKATKVKENDKWRDVAVTRIKEDGVWKIVDVGYERTESTITANTNLFNLKTFLEGQGKNPTGRPQHVTITINPDVYVHSNTVLGNPAFDTSGMNAVNFGGDAFKHKVRILVKPDGYIVGSSGIYGIKSPAEMKGYDGNSVGGGPAIRLGSGVDLFIENYGIIAGGGGGGGTGGFPVDGASANSTTVGGFGGLGAGWNNGAFVSETSSARLGANSSINYGVHGGNGGLLGHLGTGAGGFTADNALNNESNPGTHYSQYFLSGDGGEPGPAIVDYVASRVSFINNTEESVWGDSTFKFKA